MWWAIISFVQLYVFTEYITTRLKNSLNDFAEDDLETPFNPTNGAQWFVTNKLSVNFVLEKSRGNSLDGVGKISGETRVLFPTLTLYRNKPTVYSQKAFKLNTRTSQMKPLCYTCLWGVKTNTFLSLFHDTVWTLTIIYNINHLFYLRKVRYLWQKSKNK